MRVEFPSTAPGGNPPIINPTVPGQPSPNLPSVSIQPPPTLITARRQYPNIPRKWFASDEAHAGMYLAIRNLFDMNYDAQDAIQILTTSNPGLKLNRQALQVSGAISPSQRGNYLITAPSAAALTLGAPRPSVDDGTVIQLTSVSPQPHTVTTPGILQTGSAAVTTATWPAFAGGSLTLEAHSGLWLVQNNNGISFT